MTHYSTNLNDQPEVPVFTKGVAFLFEYQAVNSESESKFRVFSLYPKVPDVNLSGAEELLNQTKTRVLGVAGLYSQAYRDYTMNDERLRILMTQLKDGVNLIKVEMSHATEEQKKFADVMQ